MLRKENRFTSKELKDVGRFSLVRGLFVDIKRLERPEQKYACIMSAKNFKRSVDRNKVRRLVYCILQDSISSKEGERKIKSALLYPKKTILGADKELVAREILSSLYS